MSLRGRTFFFIFVTISLVMGGVWLLTRSILLGDFTRLETQMVERNLSRAKTAFEQSQVALEQTVYDWANWDDTHRFVQDGNSEYVEANTGPESFVGAGLDLMVFMNNDGRVIHGESYDPVKQETIGMPAGLLYQLHQENFFFDFNESRDHNTGVVVLDSQVWLLSSRPILTSRSTGPVTGTLILGQRLDQQYASRLQDLLAVPVSLHRLDQVEAGTVTQTTYGIIAGGETDMVEVVDADLIRGYTLLNDIHGLPAMLVQLDMPREVSAAGRTVSGVMLVVFMLMGVFFGLAVILHVDKVVLNRLKWVSRRTIEIGHAGQLSERIALPGTDELAILSRSIDSMLGRMEQSTRALTASEEKFRILAETSAAAIFIFQGNRIQYVNSVALELFKYTSDEILSMDFWLMAGDEHQKDFRADIESLYYHVHEPKLERFRIELQMKTREGTLVWVEFTASPIEYGGAPSVVGTAYDITERKRAEDRLRYISTHDVLSQLYNRAFFEEELNRLQSGRQFPLSIVVIDIDRMKSTNDAYGHAAGDDLVRRTAEVLRQVFRVEDIAARIGGDEFAVLLPYVDASEAQQIIRRVHVALDSHNRHHPRSALEFSIGIATGYRGCSLNKLLEQADRRMYEDKTSKRLMLSED